MPSPVDSGGTGSWKPVMTLRIGLRREDKNEWERRVPLSPSDTGALKREHDIQSVLQPFPKRAFHDAEFQAVGAEIDEKLSDCSVIFGIKEMPNEFFLEGRTYLFFAHVIKGQHYNMPMLRILLETGCNLIEYERIVDDSGRRLVYFGKEAGQAGMIDTLWALGRRLEAEGIDNPITGIRQAIEYRGLELVKEAIGQHGKRVETDGIPDELHPMVFGFAGYGNISSGAQEVLDVLPVIEISPDELLNPTADTFSSNKCLYKVVFKEEHMVEPAVEGSQFELLDYYDNPEKYNGVFAQYVPHLTVLMNCIYWSDRYPRLVTKELIHEMYSNNGAKLRIIGDISCDVEGAIEITMRATDSGNPVYVYDTNKDETVDGVEGNGPVILAVDNLPAELPREASANFSTLLSPLVPTIAGADYTVKFDALDLPPEIKRAVICYHGKLTPEYKYLKDHLLNY